MSDQSGAGGASGNGANGIDLAALEARLLEKLSGVVNEAINKGVPAVVTRSLQGALPQLLDETLTGMASSAIEGDPDHGGGAGFDAPTDETPAGNGADGARLTMRDLQAQMQAEIERVRSGYETRFTEMQAAAEEAERRATETRHRAALDAELRAHFPSERVRGVVLDDLYSKSNRLAVSEDGELGIVGKDRWGNETVAPLKDALPALVKEAYSDFLPPQQPAHKGGVPRFSAPRESAQPYQAPRAPAGDPNAPRPHPLREQIARDVYAMRGDVESAQALVEADPALRQP